MLSIHAIPALVGALDNYIWVLAKPDSADVWVVDPGEAAPLFEFLTRHQYNVLGILLTHRHSDHVGATNAVFTKYPSCSQVYGPDLPQTRTIVRGGDVIEIFDYQVHVLDTPGHTREHISYQFQDGDTPMMFSGDVIFSAGCGRINDSDGKDLYQTLQTFAAMPAETLLYCAHEYTLKNLSFAQQFDPDNQAITTHTAKVIAQRQQHIPSVPTTVGLERTINPFLRCQALLPKFSKTHGIATAFELFIYLRQQRNIF